MAVAPEKQDDRVGAVRRERSAPESVDGTLRVAVGVTGWFWLLFVAASSASTLSAGRPALTGAVVDGTSSAPVAAAVVSLSTQLAGQQPIVKSRTFTDSKGRFVFADLEADVRYSVRATKVGYGDGAYGRTTVPSDAFSTITLHADQFFRKADVTLWRLGGISGTVRDEAGAPEVGVLVRVVALLSMAGREQLAAGPMTTTDDRGAFHFGGLAAGRYLVVVPARLSTSGPFPVPPPPLGDTPRAYPMTFAGDVTAVEQATRFDVTPGADCSGVEVRLTPRPALRVSGVVDGPLDVLGGVPLRLVPAGLESLGMWAAAAATSSASDGTFTFGGIPSGNYTLEAPGRVSEYATNPPASTERPGVYDLFVVDPLTSAMVLKVPTASGFEKANTSSAVASGGQFQVSQTQSISPYYGATAVSVGAMDQANVVIQLGRAATVTGRVRIDATTQHDVPSSLVLGLDPAAGDARLGSPQSRDRIDPDRVFSIPGVLPGAYWFRALPSGWLVEEVTWQGRAMVNIPLDVTLGMDVSGVVVTLTDRHPTLTGTVSDSHGDPADASVVAFPAVQDQWVNYGRTPARFASVHTSTDGSYEITTLPAGSYYILAVQTTQGNAWRDPQLLRRSIASASRVDIAWGRSQTLDLRFIGTFR